jgi:hypothetical protein
MALDRMATLTSLKTLARNDRKLSQFGASEHQYRLNPPVPLDVVVSFEFRRKTSLPEDYRAFITNIGDGGAGPFYGLFRFGEHDHGHSHCTWEDGSLIGDLSKPFVHEVAWNASEDLWAKRPDLPPEMPYEQQDRLMEAWDRELNLCYWSPSVMNGAIPICHLGCALRQWLVLNGSQRGTIWCDYRVDERGLFPLLTERGDRVTFDDWYGTWLRDPAHGMKTFHSGNA